MNTVLSILLSLIMLSCIGSDANSVRSGSISDVDLKIGEASFASDARINYAYSLSGDSVSFDASVDNNGTEKLPVAINIADESLSFLINDRSHYYTVTADELAGASDDENAIGGLVSAAAALEPAVEYLLSMNDPEVFGSFMSEYLNAYLASCAVSMDQVQVEVNDLTIDAQTLQLEVSPETILNAGEMLYNSENETIANAAKSILEAINTYSGLDCESFSDLEQYTDGSGISVTFTLGSSDDGSIGRQSWDANWELNESILTISLNLDTINDLVRFSFDISTTDSLNTNDYSGSFDINAPASGEGLYNITGSCEFDSQKYFYAESDDENIDAANDITLSDSQVQINVDATIDGPVINASVIGSMYSSQSSVENEMASDSSSTTDFQLTVASAANENSVDSDVLFTCTGLDDIGDISLSWKSSESPADPFDSFTSEAFSIAPGSNDYTVVSINLVHDVFNFSRSAVELIESCLPDDYDIDRAFDLFTSLASSLKTVDSDSIVSSDFTFEDDSDDDSNDGSDDADSVLTMEQAAEIYKGTIPSIETPEGYILTDISAEPEMFTADYYTEDEENYIGVFISDQLEPYDEYPYFEIDDDGMVYAAELLVDDVRVSAYFSDLAKEDAVAILTEMGLIQSADN